MSEKRMTTVNMGGLKLDFDVDQHWEQVLAESFEEQVSTISDELHWLIVLHWVDVPQEVKERFWSAFREEAAERNRAIAQNGLAWVNHKAERDLLNEAVWEQERLDEARQKGTVGSDDNLKAGLMALGMKFAKLVTDLDHKAFAKMAKIIQARGTPVSEKPRGGEESATGQMLREFTTLHVKTRGLPTKKDLREACGFSGSIEDLKAAGDAMKYLGLSGLPEASGRK